MPFLEINTTKKKLEKKLNRLLFFSTKEVGMVVREIHRYSRN